LASGSASHASSALSALATSSVQSVPGARPKEQVSTQAPVRSPDAHRRAAEEEAEVSVHAAAEPRPEAATAASARPAVGAVAAAPDVSQAGAAEAAASDVMAQRSGAVRPGDAAARR
jgi:hypothetical protein